MTIGFLGGDRRTEIAAALVKKEGHTVLFPEGGAPGEDFFAPLDMLVLPYPATRDGVHVSSTALPFSRLPLSPKTALFGGRIPAAWGEGRRVLDVEGDEDFLRANAYLTAAAGVCTALRTGERAFLGVTAAVIGYGRIGRETAKMLRAMGADTAVYVRREETRRRAKEDGFRAHLLQNTHALPYDIIFGTVPAPADNLSALSVRSGALIYDLGGGLPHTLPTDGGENVLTLPLRSAPGVFAPRAAGELYGRAVLAFISHIERIDTL